MYISKYIYIYIFKYKYLYIYIYIEPPPTPPSTPILLGEKKDSAGVSRWKISSKPSITSERMNCSLVEQFSWENHRKSHGKSHGKLMEKPLKMVVYSWEMRNASAVN